MKIEWACGPESEQCPYGQISDDEVTISDCARVAGHEGAHLLGYLEGGDPAAISDAVRSFDPRKWVLHEEFRRVMIALGEWQS